MLQNGKQKEKYIFTMYLESYQFGGIGQMILLEINWRANTRVHIEVVKYQRNELGKKYQENSR